jgi:leucyl-tRNA synthetase
VRDRLVVPVSVTETEAKAAALANEAVKRALEGRAPKQVIYVPSRLVNVVG